jgi:hypothetical protein
VTLTFAASRPVKPPRRGRQPAAGGCAPGLPQRAQPWRLLDDADPSSAAGAARHPAIELSRGAGHRVTLIEPFMGTIWKLVPIFRPNSCTKGESGWATFPSRTHQ